MAKDYVRLGQLYTHGTVIAVQENAQIKRAQGTGTYEGTRVQYSDADGEVDSIKVNQAYLDLKYQKGLKDAIQSLKPGQEFTVYHEKKAERKNIMGVTVEFTDDAGDTQTEVRDLTADEIKEQFLAHWGVVSVYPGHVIPDEMAETPVANTTPKEVYKKKDTTGMEAGHAVNSALALLNNSVEDYEKVVEISTRIAAISKEVSAVWKSEGDLSKYDADVSSGLAVKAACAMVDDVEKVADTAFDVLRSWYTPVVAFIKDEGKPTVDEPTVDEKPAKGDVKTTKGSDEKPKLPF